MEKLIKFLLLALLISFCACEDVPPSQNNPTGETGDTTTEQTTPPTLAKPDCQITGSVLDGNRFWAKNENLVVAVVADKETEDPELGESHRILEVYEGTTCERVFRSVLPVNFSPDFPYYLSEITYNKISQIIAIRGFDKIYIFDLVKRELSKPLDPSFLNERYAEDAQSGMIQRLEIWENYMVGYATGEGAFAFDLSTPMAANAVLPAAEFTIEAGTEFNSMFFLESKGKGFQAILPKYDSDSGILTIHPLFELPLNLETNINKSFRNNQYLVLKELLGGNESKPIGVDMRAMKKYDIPAEVASKKDTEIIAWMKKQS